jgi:hypothetical protein
MIRDKVIGNYHSYGAVVTIPEKMDCCQWIPYGRNRLLYFEEEWGGSNRSISKDGTGAAVDWYHAIWTRQH